MLKKGISSEKLTKQTNSKLLKIIHEEGCNDNHSSKGNPLKGNKLLCEFKKRKQEKTPLNKYLQLKATKSCDFAFAKDLFDNKDFKIAAKDVPPTEVDVNISNLPFMCQKKKKTIN